MSDKNKLFSKFCKQSVCEARHFDFISKWLYNRNKNFKLFFFLSSTFLSFNFEALFISQRALFANCPLNAEKWKVGKTNVQSFAPLSFIRIAAITLLLRLFQCEVTGTGVIFALLTWRGQRACRHFSIKIFSKIQYQIICKNSRQFGSYKTKIKLTILRPISEK